MARNGMILHGSDEADLYPKVSLGKLLFNKLKQYGEKIAFIDGVTHKTLTYKEVLDQSIKLSHALQCMGLKKNDVVAIMSENCINYYIPFIACLYSGLIVHTLNPEYSTYELEHCLNISKPKVMFASNEALLVIKPSKSKWPFMKNVFSLASETDDTTMTLSTLLLIAHQVTHFWPMDLDPMEQIACVLNSSGTTGMPKGVMLTHNNISRILSYSGPGYVHFTGDDVLNGDILFFHIFGTMITLPVLMVGAKYVVMPQSKIQDLYLSLIEKYRITKLYMAPPMALFLVKSPLVDNFDVTSVKKIFTGGASLGMDLGRELERRMNARVHQMYGLTETSGGVLYNFMETDNFESIGKLIPKMWAKVEDVNTKKPVGANVKGELCFKGENIMKGYMNNEAATKESFDDEGFLHTGDVGYYDEHGYFFIVDRIKNIIKYQGFSVSPVEIEALLYTNSKIRDAAIVAIPHDVDGERPMAFIVKTPGMDLTEDEVINFVKEHLTFEKHLTGGVRFINDIPKNAGGKIMKNKLKELLK